MAARVSEDARTRKMWSAAVSLSRRRVRWKMKRIYAATNQHVIEISNPFTPSKTYHNFSLPPTASRCSLVVLHIHFSATAFRECWTLAGQYHNSMTIIFPLLCCCLFQSIWEEWERRKKVGGEEEESAAKFNVRSATYPHIQLQCLSRRIAFESLIQKAKIVCAIALIWSALHHLFCVFLFLSLSLRLLLWVRLR